jgi:uncharacterized protein
MEKERTYLVLWPTERCNLKCKYCYAYSDGPQGDMAFETAQKALDYFGDTPMKIQFAGGEPILNFELIRQIHRYISSRGYDAVFQLQTNGTLIDERIAADIKKMRIRTGVSLDGPIGVNELLRGGTKLALEGIQNLARAGVTINLNSTVTSQNVERLPELLELALYLGNVNAIGLDLVRFTGRAILDSDVHQPEAEQLIRTLWALYEKSENLFRTTGIRIGIRPIEEARTRLACPGCSSHYCYASCGKSYVILPGGDVYPCGSLRGKKEYYMGNILSKKIDRMALAALQKGEACSECAYKDACAGGCPSRAVTNTLQSVDGSLDCVLRRTAFDIVSSEESRNIPGEKRG